jgi:hypothetical protein
MRRPKKDGAKAAWPRGDWLAVEGGSFGAWPERCDAPEVGVGADATHASLRRRCSSSHRWPWQQTGGQDRQGTLRGGASARRSVRRRRRPRIAREERGHRALGRLGLGRGGGGSSGASYTASQQRVHIQCAVRSAYSRAQCALPQCRPAPGSGSARGRARRGKGGTTGGIFFYHGPRYSRGPIADGHIASPMLSLLHVPQMGTDGDSWEKRVAGCGLRAPGLLRATSSSDALRALPSDRRGPPGPQAARDTAASRALPVGDGEAAGRANGFADAVAKRHG